MKVMNDFTGGQSYRASVRNIFIDPFYSSNRKKKKTLKDAIQHDNFTSERSLQVYDCEFYSFHKDKSHRVRVKNCSEQKSKLTSISSLIEMIPRRNNDTNAGKKIFILA